MKLLTIPEVAGELAVSEKTVWRLVKRRPPPFDVTKIGRLIRVSRPALDKFVRDRTRLGVSR